MTQLDKYSIYVKLTVWGESPEDAVSYASEALDTSDLLSQDGIVGIELVDDVDSVELIESEEDEYGEDDDED